MTRDPSSRSTILSWVSLIPDTRVVNARGECVHPFGGHDTVMLVAFSIAPVGLTDPSGGVADVVAEAVAAVRATGLPTETNAMFTNVEGEWEEVMGAVKAALDVVAARAPRVSLVLKADMRPGHPDQMHSKVKAVERRLADAARPAAGTVGAPRR